MAAATTTALVKDSMRLAAARTLAWALLIGAWLVLGGLGHTRMPQWAGGMLPVALWLGAAACAQHVGRSVLLSAARLRAGLALAGLSSAAALAWACKGGATVAIGLAAISWGLLLVAAARSVQMMRPGRQHVPPPVMSAAAGAVLAWVSAGDPTAELTLTTAIGLAAAAALLAALLPSHGASRGGRTGLFDCVLPVLVWAHWRKPTAWAAQAARWSMLPMMASLAAMTQWCGEGWGLSPSQLGGMHLCAMLLPPLALQLLRVGSRTSTAATAAMVAGLVIAYQLPGLPGLMAISLCQSLAWGLVWFARVSGPSVAELPDTSACAWPPPLAGALVPACLVLVFGCAMDVSGPTALRWVQLGLGFLAAAGLAASLWRSNS